MKHIILALVALTTSAGAAQALDFTRIASEHSFRTFIAGRTLVDEFGGTLIFAANGGIAGQKDALVVSGGWVWNNGALCHRTRLDGIAVETDCKHLYLRGNTVVMQQKRGRSTEEIWTVR
ncbi:hypothetical protein JANAI62_27360 [Jannaschia pagri]|uniref:OstA-like protein n=1 Tax=Jannaschia pagri TaxID=2829797 RepID=A0ABQ4NNX4_9RHOB|nr:MULTISPECIES: hypothetical protein [unclassified Jannaschia]GIT92279.1 hypothetical protein JANAI61_27370 [Jannaschia sp. AI_61]GIT96113.1 hypothetical protein JANAI62_27360 [Jannaschia sp. AI_62]